MTTNDVMRFIREHIPMMEDWAESVRKQHADYISGLIVMASMIGILSLEDEGVLKKELQEALDNVGAQ